MSSLLLMMALGACSLGPPTSPPQFTRDEGLMYFTFGIDEAFWSCAKVEAQKERGASGEVAAKSELVAVVHLGDGKVMHPDRPERITGPRVDVRIFRNQFCDIKPPASKLFVELRGSGAYAPLNMRSEVVDVPWDMCDRCPQKPAVSQEVVLDKKDLAIRMSVDKTWHSCAKRESQWALRLYAAATEKELMRMTKAWKIFRDLETRPSLSATLPIEPLCKKGLQYVAYEVFATGSLEPASTRGSRHTLALRCPSAGARRN